MASGISGFGADDVLRGRPYGGCAIFWSRDIMANINVININSDRVCAVRLSIKYVDILLINVFMPCEGSEASTDEITIQLSIIDNIIEQNQNC